TPSPARSHTISNVNIAASTSRELKIGCTEAGRTTSIEKIFRIGVENSKPFIKEDIKILPPGRDAAGGVLVAHPKQLEVSFNTVKDTARTQPLDTICKYWIDNAGETPLYTTPLTNGQFKSQYLPSTPPNVEYVSINVESASENAYHELKIVCYSKSRVESNPKIINFYVNPAAGLTITQVDPEPTASITTSGDSVSDIGLKVRTNKKSDCSYSTIGFGDGDFEGFLEKSNIDYEHSYIIPTLSVGTHHYYIRCMDEGTGAGVNKLITIGVQRVGEPVIPGVRTDLPNCGTCEDPDGCVCYSSCDPSGNIANGESCQIPTVPGVRTDLPNCGTCEDPDGCVCYSSCDQPM
ncbi:hypothetical protein HYT54_00950, partial [Candidatus Woesearchaeota archaeon]|nr:hypothetical protein [Candidatus Woesearchaeota archaeon]